MSLCRNRQNGLTLIEIMIALLIGAFLIGGVIQIFINTKQTHRVVEEISHLQENGRFAMEFIGRDIRMADYREYGCETFTYPTGNFPLQGVDNNANANDQIRDNTDSIQINWVTSPPACIYTPNNRKFQVSTRGALNYSVGGDTVEGVENMQIQYGVDSDVIPDGFPNYYVDGTAANFPTAAQWGQVVSVRVSLLLRTIEDNIVPQPMPYVFNGQSVTNPGDRRIRRVFTSTFALRNRIN